MVSAFVAGLIVLGALPGSEAYVSGYNAERSGKLEQAIESYAESAGADPSLAPYARIRAARCLSASGHRGAAIEALRNVLSESPEGPWAPMAKLNLAGLLALEEQFDEAGAVYADAIDFSPKTWVMEQYDWAAAETFIRSPKFQERGYAYFRNKVATTVLRQRRIDAARYLEKSDGLDNRLVGLLGLIKSAESTDSLKLALRLLPECVAGGKPIEVKTLEPLLTSNKKSPSAQQRDEFAKTVAAHDENEWMRLFVVYLARSHTSIGKPEVAAFACDLLLKHWKDSPETGEALYWLGNRLAREDKPGEAVEQYLRLVKQCPEHPRADDVLLKAAELQKETGDTKGYVKSLELLTKQYPDSRYAANGWYWLGRHGEGAGHKKDAAKAYRHAADAGLGDYYAHCAARSLARYGDSPANGRNLRVDGVSSYLAAFNIEAGAYGELAGDARFDRLMFFGRHGLEEGEWEALYLGKSLTGGAEDAVVYQAMCEAGLAKAAMDLAEARNWGIVDGKKSAARLRIEYPLAYWRQVSGQCRGTGIDPYLVLAIARQESTFRPALTSYAGACGMMQVMPPTAEWLAKVDPLIDSACISNLENPDNSLRLGIRYLLRMIERSNGNLVHALASYNAGPGNCSKWLKRWPNLDLEDFVERIPFGETRDYVKRVLGGYAAYHSLYPAAD